MSSYYPINEMYQAANIELVPMTQRLNIKNRKEDWTGKSDTALRRKLQNRLNQRASRLRKKQAENGTSNSNDGGKASITTHFILPSNDPTIDPALTQSYNQTLVLRPKLEGTFDLTQLAKDNLCRIPDATTFQYTPLPTDHKLLTLMHFNLIRALCECVDVMGLTLDDMHLGDLPSPFVDPAYQLEYPPQYTEYANRNFVEGLPDNLVPTEIQRCVPHHPEADCFPFPRFRDNLILGHRDGTVEKGEFCMDVCYGVDEIGGWDGSGEDSLRGDFLSLAVGAKTGFIVWADPYLQTSWEVESSFAQKYAFLLEGCDELLASTNSWREMRGEAPLDFASSSSSSLSGTGSPFSCGSPFSNWLREVKCDL